MAHDDFLKEFQKSPSPEFGQTLLAELRQLDAEENIISSPSKSPLVLLPPRRRSHDRYLSWIASLAVLFLFSSILLFNLEEETSPDNGNRVTVSRLTGLSQLAWSPDGRLLYVSDESQLYRLNLNLQLIDAWPLALAGSVSSMLFVDDYLLLGDSAGGLSLWNTETMQMLESIQVYEAALDLMVYLPNRQIILTAGANGELVTISLRGSQLRELSRLQLANDMQLRGLALHPNEQQIIATSSNAVSLVFDLRDDGSLVASSAYGLSSFPPTAQADYLLNGQFLTLAWWDSLRIVDSETLAERYHYTLPEPFLWLSPLQSFNNRLLLSNPNGLLGLWDFSTESYLELYRGTSSHPLQAAFHPAGQLIAAITLADEVRLWRIDSLSDGSISSTEVAVNRPSSNQTVNTAPLLLAPLGDNFSEIRELYHFGDGFLLETRWSPDGSLLMLSSTSTIRLYNADLRFLREWSVLGMDLSMSQFSPDGRYLLTGTNNGDLAIWDVQTGHNITTLQVQSSRISFLAFLNGGSRILSRDSSGEFVLLNFDGSQLSVASRSQQAALASWEIQDWQATGDNLKLIMSRHNSADFSTSNLINVIDMSLGTVISAEASSTGIAGRLARFISDERIIVYEQREQSLKTYTIEDMTWLDSFVLPLDTATLNDLAYDATHEQLLLVDFDRSLALYDLRLESLRPIQMSNSLLERPAQSLSFQPAGNRAAVISSHNRIALWQFNASAAGISLTESANDSPVLGQMRSFTVSTANIAAASTSEGAVLLFDSQTGNLLRRLDLGTWGIINHDLLFNPAGTVLAVLGQDSTGVDSILNLINVQAAIDGEDNFQRSNAPIIFENEYLAGMSFNSFGDILFTGGSMVRRGFMNDESGWYPAGNLRGLTILAHHPSLGQIATLRPSNYLLLLETGNMENRYLTRLYGRSLPTNTFLEYSQDGRTLILVGDEAAPKLYDSQTGELLVTLENLGSSRFNAIALSPEYLFLAAHEGILVIKLSEALENPENYPVITLPYFARQIAISVDNRRFFYLGYDGMVRVLGLPEN